MFNSENAMTARSEPGIRVTCSKALNVLHGLSVFRKIADTYCNILASGDKRFRARARSSGLNLGVTRQIGYPT
jgi:hypothetical protein